MGFLSMLTGGGTPSMPSQVTAGRDKAIKNMEQYTGDITGLNKSGQAAVDNNMRLIKQTQDQQAKTATSQGLTNASNAALFGSSGESRERAQAAAAQQAGDAAAQLGQLGMNQQNDLYADNLALQENQKFNTVTGSMANMLGTQDDKAQQYNDAKYGAAAAAAGKKKGLFSSLAGGIGTAFGGPLGGIAAKAGVGLLS